MFSKTFIVNMSTRFSSPQSLPFFLYFIIEGENFFTSHNNESHRDLNQPVALL